MSYKALTGTEDAMHEAVQNAFPSTDSIVQRLRASERLSIAYDAGKTWPIPGRKASPTAKTETIGILITAFDDAMRWHHTDRKVWRASLKHPERRIKYSEIRPGNVPLAHLNRFLRAANSMPGLLLTLTVPRTPKYIFTKKQDSKTHPKLDAYEKWPPMVFERLVRFATFLGVGLSPVSRPGQEVYWLSDNDDIIANEDRRALACHFIKYRISDPLGHEVAPRLAPLELLTDKLAAEDILAIPDVAAGGVGEYLERCAAEFGEPEAIWLPEPAEIQGKATEIACWFGLNEGSLRKSAFSLDPVRGKAFQHVVAVRKRPIIVAPSPRIIRP